METLIDISGIDLATLLLEAVNGTQPLGIGAIVAARSGPPTKEMVQEYIDMQKGRKRLYFDYVLGRPLKLDIDTETNLVSPRLYDRDAGEGAFARVVERARISR